MHRRRRHRARVVALIGVVTVTAGTCAAEAAAAEVVRVRGGPVLVPNRFIGDTFRFVPGTVTVRPGERVTWVNQRGRRAQPHTVTVVRAALLPNTLGEVERCFSPRGPCRFGAAHLNDPDNFESGLRTRRVNRGRTGLDRQGDSLFLGPPGARRISARVTAPAGRNLHYFCALHPWMQGTLRVRAASQPSLTGRKS